MEIAGANAHPSRLIACRCESVRQIYRQQDVGALPRAATLDEAGQQPQTRASNTRHSPHA